MFPQDNAWNQDVSALPLHPSSASYVAAIDASASAGRQPRPKLHPDFGGGGAYGIPHLVVGEGEPLRRVDYTAYGDESDPGPFPIPPNAPVEGGSDRHVVVVQQGTCRLFELFDASWGGDRWYAASGAKWDLRSNTVRPLGWTSADAAGLPILPGLVRYDEVAAGEIRHALRFTVGRSQAGYVLPATHFASSSSDPNLPPMGLRLRLKAGYDISGFRGQSRVILEALKKYGMIVADNGSSWYVTGAADPRWDDEDLHQLESVPGNAFEVVDTGPVRR